MSFTLVEGNGNSNAGLHEVLTESASSGGRMNESFFPGLDAFLKKAGVKVQDVGKWVSITGPGSFTGIRIGIAALAGICAGLGKEHAGISALDAAALVSGRNEVTIAAGIRLNEFAQRSYNFDKEEFSEISLNFYSKDIISSNKDGIIFINHKLSREMPCLSKSIADPRAVRFYTDSTPLYVKRSEAEINFDKKSNEN